MSDTSSGVFPVQSVGLPWLTSVQDSPPFVERQSPKCGAPGMSASAPPQQTFETPGFVVCTFAPRMLDTHPEAIKVPYAHSNVEADEVLYYVRGQFGSRRGVEEASVTLHPRGIPHGPHPGTITASKAVTRTDELAVMVDTFRPLQVARPALEYDDPNYPNSWLD